MNCSSSPDVLQIVLEFAPCGDLHQHCEHTGRCAEGKALALTGQIASALAFCHCRRILHRDLKPANILLFPDGVCKLADFGVCFVGDGSGTTSSRGSRRGGDKKNRRGRGSGGAGAAGAAAGASGGASSGRGEGVRKAKSKTDF